MSKVYLIGLNFQDYIIAENEDEAIEEFAEKYDIDSEYLFAYEQEEAE